MKWEMCMKRICMAIALLASALSAWSIELQSPLDSYAVSSSVGYRTDPMGGTEEFQLHKGIDMVGPHHALVKAAADGVVVEHWPPPNGYFKGHPIYGGLVVIDHGNGFLTMYAHLSSTSVKTGQEVRAGQVIGRQGDTGNATGEHLHFEVIVNPLVLLSGGPNLGLDGTER
jgi:murein DD-endopeptidase MepM/ murein hydrolase activator NlpD